MYFNQYDYDKFISTHKERRKELEKLANNPYTATRESHLYNLDWKNICQSASLALVPSENWAYQNIKQKLGIPEDKKVILYAPTYRERGPISLPFNPARLLSHLNNEYVIITKLHYLNSLQREYKNVIDCTSTADLADLMKMADILISDYSSLVLDFAVLNKPIILFQYDSYDYMRQRGVYFDFEEYLPARQIIDREIDLYRLDWNSLDSDNNKLVQTFYPLEDGHSTKRIADVLALDADPRFGKDIIFLINDLNQIGGIHTFIKNMAKYYKENTIAVFMCWLLKSLRKTTLNTTYSKVHILIFICHHSICEAVVPVFCKTLTALLFRCNSLLTFTSKNI